MKSIQSPPQNLQIQNSPEQNSQEPTLQLLIACAHARLHLAQMKRIKDLARQDINWMLFLERATEHQVLPLVHQSLSVSCPQLVPQPIWTELKTTLYQDVTFSFGLTIELLRVLKAFQSAGIPVVPFKGPTLAVIAYPDPNLRTFGDLDLLLHPDDALKPKSLLPPVGYHSEDDWFLSRSQERLYHGIMGEYVMMHEVQEIELDIHCKLAGYPFVLAADLSGFWQRLQPIDLLGQSVLTFCPEDLLLYLCLHGTKDSWQKLSTICDINELVQSQPQLDWHRLLTEAQRLGLQRMLLLGLGNAQQLLGLSLPDAIAQQIQADIAVQQLVQQVKQQICQIHPRKRAKALLGKSRFHLAALERRRDRWLYRLTLLLNQIRLLFLANARDRDFIALPRSLSALYLFVRPIRIFREYGLTLFKVLLP